MGSVVQLGPGAGAGPLGYKLPVGVKESVKFSKDLMGLRLRAGKITKLGGKEDGEEIEGKVIEVNQRVVIKAEGTFAARQYQAFIGVNPVLLGLGEVTTPGVMPATDLNYLCMQFKAFRKVDLAELLYLFEIYIID